MLEDVAPWLDTQPLTFLYIVASDEPDGGARLEFNTHGLEAVRHWVLQFGPRAVVESPRELADWVRDEARRTLAVYSR